MAKPTSATDRRPSPRGCTLVEAMMASALLSVSVVGIGGAISASYAHDQHTRTRQQAFASGVKLMEELSTLPLDAPAADRVALADFAAYADSVEAERAASAVAARQATKQAANNSNDGQGSGGGGSGPGGSSRGLLGGLIDTVTGVLSGLLGGSSGSGSSGGSGGNSGDGGAGADSPSSLRTNVTRQDTTAAIASRSVSIERRATLDGSPVGGGDLAIVTVRVDVGDGKPLTLKRLVTSAEAASNVKATN